MKVLITGATGFIGCHLVKALIQRKYTVAALVRSVSQSRCEETCRTYPCDTYEEIVYAITDYKPDVVIHLAALYINKHLPEDINPLIASNVLFGTELLEAMCNNDIKRFINFGTRWQHIDDSEYNPANLYAATKEAFQKILVYYGKNAISYKTLELCDTFGSGDNRKKIVDLLFDACMSGKKIDLSPGGQVLDIVSVDDICSYIAENIQKEEFYDNQRVGISGMEITLRELGRIVEKITGTSGLLNFGGKPYRENEVMTPPKEKRMVKIASADIQEQLMLLYGEKQKNISK